VYNDETSIQVKCSRMISLFALSVSSCIFIFTQMIQSIICVNMNIHDETERANSEIKVLRARDVCVYFFYGIKQCDLLTINDRSASIEDLSIRFVRAKWTSPLTAPFLLFSDCRNAFSFCDPILLAIRKRLFPLRSYVIAQGWTRWRASDNIMVSSRSTWVTLPKVFPSPQVRRVLFHHSARLHPQGFIRDPIPTPSRGYSTSSMVILLRL